MADSRSQLMLRPNAHVELKLFPPESGGYEAPLSRFPVRMLAWPGPVYGKVGYGFALWPGPAAQLVPGETLLVDVMFLDLAAARKAVSEGEWVAVGDPTRQRGNMRVISYS